MNIASKPGLPPSSSRTQPSAAPPKPAPTATDNPQAPALQKAATQDGFEESRASRKPRWEPFTPVIRQSQRDNCGAAVATMLARSMGKGQDRTNEQLMNRFESRFTDGKGTTPAQLGSMLADQGIEVSGSTHRFSPYWIKKTLSEGGKLVAMVDSNLISPKHPQKAGSAHWVVIDGFDGKNSYRIKDPGRGTGYWIQTGRLAQAINSGWRNYGGGGMLMVRTASEGTDTATLRALNEKNCVAVGTKPGIGSNTSTLGRESAS
jgi:hypothetical protein